MLAGPAVNLPWALEELDKKEDDDDEYSGENVDNSDDEVDCPACRGKHRAHTCSCSRSGGAL